MLNRKFICSFQKLINSILLLIFFIVRLKENGHFEVTAPEKKFISVVGNIGVGKTTFAEFLAKQFDWKVYYESVIDNPYLPSYYEDMKKWSFHLQIYFFTKRFQDQLQIRNSTDSGVTDRSILEDPKVFAKMLNKQGHLSDLDFKTYLDLFENFEPFIIKPDLYIYLRASTWTLISRIRNRGRDFEMGITSEFLHQLNIAYEEWIRELSQTHNLIIIDTDKFNIENDIKKRNHFADIIKQRLDYPVVGFPVIE